MDVWRFLVVGDGVVGARTVAVLFLALLGGIGLGAMLDMLQVFKPRPYTDVEVLAVEWEDCDDSNCRQEQPTTLHVVVGWTKTDTPCMLQRAGVWGVAFGEVTSLDYLPYRGPNVTRDRIAGRQKLDWTIRTQGVIFDQIDIRTRHVCYPAGTTIEVMEACRNGQTVDPQTYAICRKGIRVDRQMASVEVPPIPPRKKDVAK